MRGRKPLPNHLKLVQGNRGKRPIKAEQVEASPAMPLPPAFLCDDAKQEWERVAPMLYALRLLSELDVAALAAYCQAYATWKHAHEALNTLSHKGLMIRSAKNNLIQNPLLGIANAAAASMVRYASEFALTPVARARLSAPPGGGKNVGDKYFL
ncbi:MAG TPA: phage terminase small subunit P27 family [Aestuariivirga sp.]|nr:phage terminase small subunit P27 family [Aestuariivirga sp.]